MPIVDVDIVVRPGEQLPPRLAAAIADEAAAVFAREVGVIARRGPDAGRATLFVFLVEPPAGWDGILEPGESSGGEWTKTDLLVARTFECSADVVGVLRVAVRSIDGDEEEKGGEDEDDDRHDENLCYVATEPTILNCVF